MQQGLVRAGFDDASALQQERLVSLTPRLAIVAIMLAKHFFGVVIWVGFGGFEAMTGMLMFGWSTAVLAAVVQKIHAIEE